MRRFRSSAAKTYNVFYFKDLGGLVRFILVHISGTGRRMSPMRAFGLPFRMPPAGGFLHR